MCARAGVYILNNTVLKAYHMPSVRDLRKTLDRAESKLLNLAKELGWKEAEIDLDKSRIQKHIQDTYQKACEVV